MDIELFRKYRAAADLLQPGLGAATYDRFAEFNKMFFDNQVPAMPIVWVSVAPYGHWVGRASGDAPKGELLRAAGQVWIFASKAYETYHTSDGQPAPTDYGSHVLLHEMTHQYLYARNENGKHEGAPWRREITRIGKMLGLPDFYAGPSIVRKVIVGTDDDGNTVRKSKRFNAPSPATGGLSVTQETIARFPHFGYVYDKGMVVRTRKADELDVSTPPASWRSREAAA
jgi:hypothetical protein